MEREMKEYEWLSARVPGDFKGQVGVLADRTGHTVSDLIRLALREWMDRNIRDGNSFEWRPEE